MKQTYIPVTEAELNDSIKYTHYTELDDYLYNYDSDPVLHDATLYGPEIESNKFKKLESVKKFDQLDFVIIDVESSLLPW